MRSGAMNCSICSGMLRMWKGRDVGVDGGDLAAHGGDRVDAGDGAHHQGYALDGGLCVIGGVQREIECGRWLLHHQAFGDVARHADDLEVLAMGGGRADAVIEGAGEYFGGGNLVFAEFDLAAERIRVFPELAREFLADDHGCGLAGLVLLAEGAARGERDPGGRRSSLYPPRGGSRCAPRGRWAWRRGGGCRRWRRARIR